MARPNLVLVHSFPTNSIMLRGLIEFLEDHFTLHFVDLPGFTRQVPPLPQVSLEGYARFLRSQIDALGLKEYVLGGISFGFLVVNLLPPGPGCKAILAMEPFLGVSGIRMPRLTRRILCAVLWLVLLSRSERRVWNSTWFNRRIRRRGTPARADCLLREVDPHTFLATARILLTWDQPVQFHRVPYILFINPDDRTIGADYVRQVFESGTNNLLVSTNSVDHYPQTISKEYFAANISASEIERIKSFVGD